MAEDDTEYLKLPVEDQVKHSLWKARVHGYQELAKKFAKMDPADKEFPKYLGSIKGFVTDSHAAAQEKGLEAALVFVENAKCAAKSAGEVCNGAILKCLGAPRGKTKEKSQELLLMYIEIEKGDVVMEELQQTGFSNKTPKIRAAAVQTTHMALSQFGAKALPVKAVVKAIPNLLEDKDKNVRDEAKILTVELHKWLGAALKPQLQGLKPVQLTELEAEFANVAGEKPIPTRYLRSQRPVQQSGAAHDIAGGEGPSGVSDGAEAIAVAEEVDPWEYMEPVDVIGRLSREYKEFHEHIASKKWIERKNALEFLLKLVEGQKLEASGNYGELVGTVKNVIAKDSNINVVSIAGRCLAGIANGLRKKFASFSTMCLPVLVEKFKEKKQIVRDALREAIDAVGKTTTLDGMSEELIKGIENKNPSVRQEVSLYLGRAFAQSTPSALPKKVLKIYFAPLVAVTGDQDATVRDAAMEAIGVAMRVAGEKNVQPFLADVDGIKMAKIKEYCDKAVVKSAPKAPSVAGKASSAGPKQGIGDGMASAEASAVTSQKPAAPTNEASTSKATSTNDAKATKGKPVAKKKAGGASAAGSGKGKGGGAGSGSGGAKAAKMLEERELAPEEVDLQMEPIFAGIKITAEGSEGPSSLSDALQSANWKERLAAVSKVFELTKMQEPASFPVQATIRALNKGKRKESNIQVLQVKVELYTWLADNTSRFSTQCLLVILPEVMEKLPEKKDSLGERCGGALLASSEALELGYVANQVLSYAFEQQKSPKVQSETFVWLGKALQEFGLKVDVKTVINYAKKGFAATNPDVRQKAIGFAGILYLHVGSQVRIFFEDEKPALLQQIDQEWQKYEGQKPPAPVRGLKKSKGAMSGGIGGDSEDVVDEEDEDDGSGAAPVNVADLVERKDISGELTDALLNECGDANWKVRKEAMEKIQTIISDAKFITPNLGGLPEVLKTRLGESNKNVATITLEICLMLGTALGPKVKDHIRVIVPGIFGTLSDMKPLFRQKGVAVLNAWLEQTHIKFFLEGDLIVDALKTENPNQRAEVYNWLAIHIPKCNKKLPDADLKQCVSLLYAALEDRSPDVRKAAQEAVLSFMMICGYEHLAKQAAKLKPVSSANNVQALLDKARPKLPTKAPPPSAARAVAGPAAGDDDDDDLQVPSPAGKAAAPGSGKKGAGSRASSTARNGSNKKPGEGLKKKDNDDGDDGALIETGQKRQRFNDEAKMKVLKWQFVQPRPEYIDQLREQMSTVCKPALFAQLFHIDFRQHLKAIEALSQSIQTCPEATMGALDLILKWTTLRFSDTNPSVLLKCLEYIQSLFLMCDDCGYMLHDLEVGCFVPFLLAKSGDGKDVVRAGVRRIIEIMCRIYPPSKLFPYLMDAIKSKNARQRSECLEQLGMLIERNGIEICQPGTLKQIAQQIGDKDNSVRNAALNTIVQAYLHIGEQVYRNVGNLNDKDLSLLTERLKRCAKNRPVIKKPSPSPGPGDKRIRTGGSSTALSQHGNPDRMTNGVGYDNGRGSPEPQKEERKMRTGMFQLDMDYIGENPIRPEDYELPQLIDHTEIYEMMKQPIQLYQTRFRARSPTKQLLSTSTAMEASTTLDSVITQVASTHIDTSIQALAQLDELLKDEDKSRLLSGHIDQLLQAIYFQFRMAYNTHMSDDHVDKDQVIALYRNLCMTLLSLLNCPCLIREACDGPLKDLIYNLITVLLDQRLNAISEGAQVIRSINVMVVKLVEKSDTTQCLVALVRLLHDAVQSETCSPKFMELVMKCLWKLSRMLPDISTNLQLDRIVLEMHKFLEAFPTSAWKTRPSDTPLRTIKTILHTLVKVHKEQMVKATSVIAHPERSEVVAYIRKVYDKEMKLQQAQERIIDMTVAPTPAGQSGDTGETSRMQSFMMEPSPPRMSDDEYRSIVNEIFKKIGNKETTKIGLNELYDFTQVHPHVDIAPFMHRSTEFFSNYVHRSLKQIDAERKKQRSQQHQSSSSLSGGGSGDPASSPSHIRNSASMGELNDPASVMKRLNDMKKRLAMTTSTTSNIDSGLQHSGTQPLASQHYARLLEYRAKLGLDTTDLEHSIGRALSETSSDMELKVGEHVNELSRRTPEKATAEEDAAMSTPKISAAELDNLRSRLENVKRMSATRSNRPGSNARQ